MDGVAAEPRDTTHAHLAGDVIGRHQHGYHQLLYVSAGVLAVQTGEASWVASSARAIWLPAGIWHQHRVHGHSSVHTIGFAAHDVLLDSVTPVVVAVDALVRELIIACSEPDLPPQESRRLRAVLRDRLRRALVEPLTLPTPTNPFSSRPVHWSRTTCDNPAPPPGWPAASASANAPWPGCFEPSSA